MKSAITVSLGSFVESALFKDIFVELANNTETKKEEATVPMDIDDSKPSENADNSDEKQDYSKLTAAKLRQLCKGRGLTSTGGKDKLVERLDKEKSGTLDYNQYVCNKLREFCRAKSLDSNGKKNELIERLVESVETSPTYVEENKPKSIEEFYDIDPRYHGSWQEKCIEIEKITNQIFSNCNDIGGSFLAQNENTFNAIIAAPFNNSLSFFESLNNCGIQYKKEKIGSSSENNPVTPDILMGTMKNQTNIVVECTYGNNSRYAKYRNAGYIVSIADFYRHKSKNQSCVPMLSITATLDRKIKIDFDNSIGEFFGSIGELSVYGYVPSNSPSKNMKYIECVILEQVEFTRKNFANLLQAICSVEQLPQCAPISSNNPCIHKDKVFKCYDNSQLLSFAGYLPGAKLLCDNSVLVYDKIEGSHHPQNLKQVFCILVQLYELWKKNLCHGDIRLVNIIFGEHASQLIDFDFYIFRLT